MNASKVTSSVFKLENEIKGASRSWPERMRLDMPGDGARIRIYTMWNYNKNNDNFTPVIKFAKKQGWTIEEL